MFRQGHVVTKNKDGKRWFTGTIIAVILKMDGTRRFIVETEEGDLHICCDEFITKSSII